MVEKHRREIHRLCALHGATEIRLFGSAARGDDVPGSDLDFLVTFQASRTLLDHVALRQDLEDFLGVRVDVLTPGALSPYLREAVVREAIPV